MVREHSETLQATDETLNVWFEPWGDGETFAPGTVVELRATGRPDGRLEIDMREECVIVYGWPGCTLQVFANGILLRDFSIPVPEPPPGMTTRQFVELL